MRLYPHLTSLVSSFLVSTNRSVLEDVLANVIQHEQKLCVCTIALPPFLISVTKVDEFVFITMSRYLLKDWLTVINTNIDEVESVFAQMRPAWLRESIQETPFAATNTEVVRIVCLTQQNCEELAQLLGEIDFA